MKKIYLIGMPGSGKTTFGKRLASELKIPFIDLDLEIERTEKRKVSEIFSTDGEDYFRKTEAQILRQWATNDQNFVLATGGGAPCFFDGIDLLNQTGFTFFLDVPVEELVRRLSSKNDRPLLAGKDLTELGERLTKLYSERITTYQKAKFHITDANPLAIRKLLGLEGEPNR